ncbi:MAG: pqq-dependent dehydrogenase, methanol/ethanol family [Phycisphaerales bacterium]|nr:pqq-dependent dehydrogenase, methanol/ethanol family [Phycisphaerales bacterium]
MATWVLLVLTCVPAAFAQSGPVQKNWPMASGNYENSRYSALDQITSDNVKNLRVAWTFGTGVNRGHEEAPVVVGSTMYLVTPYPNFLYALDLSQSGAIKWKFEPKPLAAAQGEACCDYVNRGVAVADGRVFMNTLDGRTIALDADSGKLLWDRRLCDINVGETMTMAPLVIGDKVLVGNAGSQFGARGWIQALDAKSGTTAWKAFSTGSDADCLIGPSFKPYYAQDRGHDLGISTWPIDQWKIGGGTVWGWVSYDPDLDLLFYGTGDPASWNADVRPGDNKWCSGIFARRPSTGEAVWFYQYTAHDLYGHDGINESIVTDIELKPGEGKRKVLLHADRNGHLYVLDRQSGEVLSATPFVRVTATTGVDLKTGYLQFVADKKPQLGKTVRDIAPAAPGGKDWQPSAFSPRTGLMYLPHQTLSMDFEEAPVNYIAGTPYIGAHAKFYADPVDPGDGSRGRFTAWDPAAQKAAWTIKERFPVWCGTVVTAGDVVFYGTMDRWFKAVDAKTGRELWKFQVDSGIVSQPITYLAPDGKQYVAVVAGVGGWPGKIVSNDLKPEDPGSAHGFGNAMKDLPNYTAKGGTLYVFCLQ